jgi:hypothetical protein
MTLADALLTDKTPLVEETNNVEKSEHKKCFETDMVGMVFLDSMRLLKDPGIWIWGTATSVHTLPYTHGMVHETETKKNGSITVVNGVNGISSDNTAM